MQSLSITTSCATSCFRLGEVKTVTVTPAEPKYYQYRFPAGVSSLVVKVESESSLCSVISVQDVHVSSTPFSAESPPLSHDWLSKVFKFENKKIT